MEALQKEIVACNANHRVEEGFETLKKFEQIADHDVQIAQQFILRSKVLLGRLDQRYTPQEQIDLLMQAIRLTVPRFNLDEIERFFIRQTKSRSSIKLELHTPMMDKIKKQLISITSC